MRSSQIKVGFNRAPHRALLKATGVTDADMGKPFIAIVNSYVDVVPGHVHLQEFGRLVKEAVRTAGGVPFEFNTIGVDDGIAMGHAGMKYSLPSRELIADCVETMLEAHQFDGMVCIPNCDKIVPGMLMAAMRVNIPAIFISGGAMPAGRTPDGQVIDLISVFEGVGAFQAGKFNDVPENSDLFSSITLVHPENKAAGTLSASRISSGTGDLVSLEIYAEKGMLRYSSHSVDYFEYYLEETGQWTRQVVGSNYSPITSFPSGHVPPGWLRSMIHAHYIFLNGNDHKTFVPDLRHGLAVQRVLRETADYLAYYRNLIQENGKK